MMIHVITEGATEREVGKVLYEREIFSHRARPKPPAWKSFFGHSREGYESVMHAMREKETIKTIRELPGLEHLLLVFDQEDARSPQEKAAQICSDLNLEHPFGAIEGWPNLFRYTEQSLHIVLHISDAKAENIQRRDFDAYILRLLQGSYKEQIAGKITANGLSPQVLLRKAEEEMTRLMIQNGYPWTHAKSWLYAYVTTFQYRQSHVWFAKKVVEIAPEEALREIFASLFEAWDLLIRGDGQ